MAEPVIIGTIALDSIETPFGKVDNVIGGSASYASIAASYFSNPGILSIVGVDFPESYLKLLQERDININGIVRGDKTFRWQGYYEYDMNEAKTIRTELNSLEYYKAPMPDEYKNSKYFFLGNIDPELQIKVIKSVKNPELIVMDTMNFWIQHKRNEVLETIKKVDILVLNDSEARQLFNTPNLVIAAKIALKMVSMAVIIKKGEHGSLVFYKGKHFSAPSYPLENIKDPTGCGDCFGGGLIGYIAKTKDYSFENIKKGVIYGSVIASYNAEGFGIEALRKLSNDDIEKRYKEFKDIREF